jgi:acetyl-CoA C-acetyltransferase
MQRDETAPVVAGVAQILQRCDDPRDAAEPIAMMESALRAAGDDAGAPALLAQARSLYVTRGMWRYGNPGRVLAERLGAAPCETVGTPYGGNYAQACVIDAARRIAAGELDVALVAGAENGRTQGQAQRAGLSLAASPAPGEPDRKVAPDKPIFHEAELARGMNSASDVFAVIDASLRRARGESLEAHALRAAALWAGLSEAATRNPNAWIPKAHTAEQIGTPGPENPMISFPYTRLMNANARVDMGAAIVVCSRAAARRAGVSDAKLVHLLAATEATDGDLLSPRQELHRSHAIRVAGARALDLAGLSLDEIDHFDLYSCFPSAVAIAAAELGLPETRPLSVTGGLTFGGGPLNSYGLHAVARMVEVLRAEPGATGFVHGNGGWLAKHSIALYSTAPPPGGFRAERPQAEVDRVPVRTAHVDWDGPVAIEAYTVAHAQGRPRLAHVACLTDDGARTWATLDEAETLAAMMREEFGGRRGRVDGKGHLKLTERGRSWI